MNSQQQKERAEELRKEREREMRERQQERREEEKRRRKELEERLKEEREATKERQQRQRENEKDRQRMERERERERRKLDHEQELQARREQHLLEKGEEQDIVYQKKPANVREGPQPKYLCRTPGVQLVPKKKRKTDAAIVFEDFVEGVKPLRKFLGPHLFNTLLAFIGVCVLIFFVILLQC